MPYLDRARKHEGKMLGLFSGEESEINFPIATPGETVYLTPRGPTSSKTVDNSGSRPSGKSGKNY